MPSTYMSPRGLVAYLQVFHLEVMGSILAASIIFSAVLTILPTFLFFHPLEPIIFCKYVGGRHLPSKTNTAKIMECSEISSPINRTHKTPSKPFFSLLDSITKTAKFCGDVTLVGAPTKLKDKKNVQTKVAVNRVQEVRPSSYK